MNTESNARMTTQRHVPLSLHAAPNFAAHIGALYLKEHLRRQTPLFCFYFTYVAGKQTTKRDHAGQGKHILLREKRQLTMFVLFHPIGTKMRPYFVSAYASSRFQTITAMIQINGCRGVTHTGTSEDDCLKSGLSLIGSRRARRPVLVEHTEKLVHGLLSVVLTGSRGVRRGRGLRFGWLHWLWCACGRLKESGNVGRQCWSS